MLTVFGKPLRGPTPLTRLVLLALLSAALMMLDHRTQQLERVRAALMVILYPVQLVASVPVGVYNVLIDVLTTDEAVQAENERLKAERQQLLARLQQFEALEAENERLRAMLGAGARVAVRAVVAELAGVSLEPFSRRLLIRRGSRDGVYVGQPVIDAYGVVGQVTHVAPHVSTVTLITDPSHAIPVIDNRSGLRAMVFGSGEQDTLNVPYLSGIADIKEGDLLVTSGMGGVYPAGYPVAVVTSVEDNPSEGFLIVRARPAAQLNHGKQVLLIWPEGGPKESTP
ncbi:MAG TPA: rod shape-determining protein MreC [Burkholderiales bacterium]